MYQWFTFRNLLWLAGSSVQNLDIRPIFGKPTWTPRHRLKKRTCPGKPGHMCRETQTYGNHEWLLQWQHYPAWRHDSLGLLHFQSLFQFIQISDACFVHLLWQYSPHALINWIQFWWIWGHSWGGINSGVSFCNSSTAALAWWAFQVLQVSVETLFRLGGKLLLDFMTNLFRKIRDKFHHNRPSFVEDCLFFWRQCSQ